MIRIVENKTEEIILDLDGIANSSTVSTIAKNLARFLHKNEFITLEQFFGGLSDLDLFILNAETRWIEENCDQCAPAAIDISIIAQMLMYGEGCWTSEREEIMTGVILFTSLVRISMLERLGLAEINWKLVSFDSYHDDKKSYILNPRNYDLENIDFSNIQPTTHFKRQISND